MKKIEDIKDIIDIAKLRELLVKEEPAPEPEPKKNPVAVVFTVIGIIAAVLVAAYGIFMLIENLFLDYEDFDEDLLDEEDEEDEDEEDIFVDGE